MYMKLDVLIILRERFVYNVETSERIREPLVNCLSPRTQFYFGINSSLTVNDSEIFLQKARQ